MDLFQKFVYLFGLYLTTLSSIKLSLVGIIIIFSHLYKDITCLKKWPLWSEFIGMILSFILLKEGTSKNEIVIVLVGILKLYTHSRQIIKQDNKYYFY